jgi:hypothetical protein
MNCKDFENIIHELVSRRVVDRTKQLEALEHAGRCLWCALRLDEETKLTASLQDLAGTLQGERAPLRVEQALVQAFRERNARASAALFGPAGKLVWRGLSWGLVFAGSVALAWIVMLQWPRLHPRSTNPKLKVSVLDPHQQHSGEQVAPHRSLEKAPPDDSAGELTTDFIPLGTCDDSQCMDEATLVRVALPSDALLAFGLGMDNDSAREGFVQADVALGSDGVPFAIRFVD